MTDDQSKEPGLEPDGTPEHDAPGADQGTSRRGFAYDGSGRSTSYEDETDDAPEPETGGSSRPPVAIILVALVVLIAVGVGIAFLMSPQTPTETAQVTPTVEELAPEGLPEGALPEQMPLLTAIGSADSTEVIVEVGEGVITRGDFVRLYQPGSEPAPLLEQLIQIELVVQQASQEGVVVDEAAIDQQVEEIKQSQAGGDDALFQEFLVAVEVGDEANLRRLLARDYIVEQMILEHTVAEQARARHILLASNGVTETTELKAEAEALLVQLNEGADFVALAAERSDDPGSKDAGGELGWAPRGVFVPEFEEAIFSMQAGEIRLVESDFGWHIIQLLDEAQVRPFESADFLQSTGGQQAFAESFIPWIEELQANAEANQLIRIIVPADQLVSLPETQ
ncbi:peptidylprolyl isomerase [Candidatus Chloroploca sp. Khr17]|uniref:peptidylprolyl isomerase n=1 Tax=Candidatus Chloroploca sp. Khr17 TaxID=2496869 RepID=UPI00101CAEC5|nr:peptidylprolyl isomerase [Candidatus Chloroploca sp. Khr17]